MTQSAMSAAQEQTISALEAVIGGQPEDISAAITSNFEQIRAAAVLLAGARRVRLCGVGIGSFAAVVCEHMLRSIGLDARATHGFDLASYPANFDPGDLLIVLSQRGADPFTARALLRAIHAGLKTIAITGQAGLMRGADVRIETIAPQRAETEVAPITTILAVLAAAAARCEPRSPLAAAVPALSEAVRVMLGTREVAREVARVMSEDGRRTLITGAGGSYAAAGAGALLVRQSSFLAVEASHLEDALQAGLLALNPGDVLIQVAPEGPTDDRQADLAVVANTIGFERWKIGGARDGARWQTDLPGMPEVVTPILSLIPLQWLALECALARGTDPVALRRDEERYDKAFGQISV